LAVGPRRQIVGARAACSRHRLKATSALPRRRIRIAGEGLLTKLTVTMIGLLGLPAAAEETIPAVRTSILASVRVGVSATSGHPRSGLRPAVRGKLGIIVGRVSFGALAIGLHRLLVGGHRVLSG